MSDTKKGGGPAQPAITRGVMGGLGLSRLEEIAKSCLSGVLARYSDKNDTQEDEQEMVEKAFRIAAKAMDYYDNLPSEMER